MDTDGFRKLLTQIDRQRAQFAEPILPIEATATGELREKLDQVKADMQKFRTSAKRKHT